MELQIDLPEWAEPLEAEARYKGAYGGRSSGKSHRFAEMAVEDCFTNPGMRFVCIREVQKSLEQSAKRLICDKIQSLGLSQWFDVRHDRIITPGDGVIIFQGMQNHTSDSIKSLEGFQRAWMEEAQRISLKSLSLLRPTIRAPGSQIWATWNRDSPNDPIDKFLLGGKPRRSIVVEVNYWDNPWFPDESKEEMLFDFEHDEDKYLHVWCGKYRKISKATVFRNWKVEEFNTPDDAVLRYGSDFGFGSDPSVILRGFADLPNKTIYIDYCELEHNVKIDKLADFYRQVPGVEKYTVRADSAKPDVIDYLRRGGIPNIIGAKKGAGSVPEGVELLRGFKIVVHPRCKPLIDELTYYRYKVDPLTEEVLPVLEDRNNHCIDSARYAFEPELRAKRGLVVG